MTNEVAVAMIGAIGAVIGSATTAVFNYLISRKKTEKMDLSEGIERDDKIQSMLEELRFTLDADRVSLWYGSNGENSFAMHHFKKLTMTSEANRQGYDNIKDQSQLMPIAIFERNIRSLSVTTTEAVVSDERNFTDTLARLNNKNNVTIVASCKVFAKRNNWAGILIACWDHPRIITDDQKFELTLASQKIGGIKI